MERELGTTQVSRESSDVCDYRNEVDGPTILKHSEFFSTSIHDDNISASSSATDVGLHHENDNSRFRQSVTRLVPILKNSRDAMENSMVDGTQHHDRRHDQSEESNNNGSHVTFLMSDTLNECIVSSPLTTYTSTYSRDAKNIFNESPQNYNISPNIYGISTPNAPSFSNQVDLKNLSGSSTNPNSAVDRKQLRRSTVHPRLESKVTVNPQARRRKRALTIDPTPSSVLSHTPTFNRAIKEFVEAEGFQVNRNGIQRFPPHLLSYADKYEKKKNIAQRDKGSRFDDFHPVRVLGEGRTSRVTLVKDTRSGELYARKTVFLSNDIPLFLVARELSTLIQCEDYKNIIRFEDAFFDGFRFHFIMQFVDGAPIDEIKDMDEDVATAIIYQALHTMKYLHQKRIIHMDVKPGNMILSKDGEVYFCDFGLSLQIPVELEKVDSKYSSEGSIAYLAPEKIQNLNFSLSSDIWSLGISYLNMLTSFLPEASVDKYYQTMDNILSVPDMIGEIAAKRNISIVSLNFLKQCLTLDPEARPSANDLLHHELFQDWDWQRSVDTLKRFMEKRTYESIVHRSDPAEGSY